MNLAQPAAKRLRVLIVSEMSPPHATGGGEVRYGLLARQLVENGHVVTWLTMRQKDSPDRETIDGVEHLHVGPRLQHPPLRPLSAKLRFMVSVCVHLLRRRYDIVDCQTYAPLPAAWLACRLRRMPMVATIHDTAAAGPAGDQWLSGFDRQLAQLVERRLYRLSYDQVLTVSAATKIDLVERFGLADARVSVVNNCIDVQAIAATPPAPEATDLVFVGRLIPHKHPEDVLKVLVLLNGQRQKAGLRPWRAKFVGGGPLAAELRAQAVRLGVESDCVFCGELARHQEVVAEIRSARVLVLPSTREGFGLVLAEAMAAGVALAAYDIPAVRQTVGPELAPQCLVPAGDAGALAQAVGRFLDTDERRADFAARGFQRVVENFDLHGYADRVESIYRIARARCAST